MPHVFGLFFDRFYQRTKFAARLVQVVNQVQNNWHSVIRQRHFFSKIAQQPRAGDVQFIE